MKYPVWFVRLIFAAWMIPAGLNHFVPLFPQPLGSQPLSQEWFQAMWDSHLFDLVKAVELIVGVGVLTGFYMPLALVVCMAVSFNVWYWDTPLEGWGSPASIFGWAVLISNVLLCLAYIENYRSMFAWRAKARPTAQQLVLAGRLIFGAWMLLNGINYFVVSLYPLPAGTTPVAAQFMTAITDAHVLDVVMGIELVTGALILVGVLVPLALCVVMPLTLCAAFWGVIVDHQPLTALLTLAALALNGLLMLAYIDYYKGVLQRHAVFSAKPGGFDILFVNPMGRNSRGQFIGAVIALLVAFAFYYFLVPGRNAQWVQLTLLYPAVVLHARRLHDMGRSAWPVLVPAALLIATAWFYLFAPDAQALGVVTIAAVVVSAGFIVWGLIGKGQSEANRFGQPALGSV
jgi:uncharacterized membrane protein YhaH (DUF805 family)/uncharacterized membrane protein YphA (DoxX/SURF4 family)